MENKKFKMQRGEKAYYFHRKFDSECPVIGITGEGKGAYLWIGGEGGPCYATLSGQKTLVKLANNILETVNPTKRKK